MPDSFENKPLKRKRAATGSQIEKELKRIYATEDPVDLTTIHRGGPRKRWPIVVGVVVALFVLAGITWAGIMRFGGSVRYNDQVRVTVDGPTSVRAGDIHTWTIKYKNDERLPIARSEIVLRLPSVLTVLATEPSPTTGADTWNIGTLGAHAEGNITVTGRVLESVGAPLALQAVLNYRPANFNADFQKIASWDGRVNDSIIEAVLEVPEETVPGDNNPFTVKIQERKDIAEQASLPSLKIRFDPDHKLSIKSASPAFTNSDERAWTAPVPEEKPLTLEAQASFLANASGEIPVRVDIGTVNTEGRFLVLVPLTATVKVLPGDLVLTMIRNGLAGAASVGLGEALHISVDYENKSGKPLTDAEIALTLLGTPSINGLTPVDWETFEDIRKGKRVGNTVTWTKKEIPELALLAPGDKGSIDVTVHATNTVFTTTDRDYVILASAKGSMASIGGKKTTKQVTTPVLETRINTDAMLVAAALYESGTLPPKSGESTTYRLVWTLTNKLHEIAGIKVSAALPQNVVWINRSNVSAGDLRWDESSRTITWTLNRLPTSINSVSVDFFVELTPGVEHIGSVLPLISTSSFTATDKTTNAELTREEVALDTNLERDPNNEGKGKVQP